MEPLTAADEDVDEDADLSKLWGAQSTYERDVSYWNYADGCQGGEKYHDEYRDFIKAIADRHSVASQIPYKEDAPEPTNYELLTSSGKIEEMANKHEVIRDALRELEVLIKLHENIDNE